MIAKLDPEFWNFLAVLTVCLPSIIAAVSSLYNGRKIEQLKQRPNVEDALLTLNRELYRVQAQNETNKSGTSDAQPHTRKSASHKAKEG